MELIRTKSTNNTSDIEVTKGIEGKEGVRTYGSDTKEGMRCLKIAPITRNMEEIMITQKRKDGLKIDKSMDEIAEQKK